jgi:hypothetical protein
MTMLTVSFANRRERHVLATLLFALLVGGLALLLMNR